MTDRTKTIIIGTLIAIVIALIVFSWGNTTSSKYSDESLMIWEIEAQINELRTAKERCYNNLSYSQSIQNDEWIVRYCFNRDDAIMELREQADQLKAKDYDKRSWGLE